MSTLREEQQQLNEALADFAFALMDAVGVVWLSGRFGIPLSPWAVAARDRRDNA